MSIPMLMLWREKLAVRGGHCRDGGFNFSSSLMGAVPRMTQSGSAVIHTPDRSGFPFARRGGAAARSTSPVAVRGARGLGTLNHWAPSDPDAPTMTTIIRIVCARSWMRGHAGWLCMYDSLENRLLIERQSRTKVSCNVYRPMRCQPSAGSMGMNLRYARGRLPLSLSRCAYQEEL